MPASSRFFSLRLTSLYHAVSPPSPTSQAPSLRALLSLPDAQFLQKSSTSPLVEPPFFVPDMRDCYEHLAKRPRWQMSFPEGEKEVHWFERSALSNQWLPGKE